jgi:hypothetical protein
MLKIITLLILMVMMSSPASAKRYHTMEDYYAARARHISDGTWHRHHRRHHHRHHRVEKAEKIEKAKRVSLPTEFGELRPLTYLYATGTSILDAYTGRTPYPNVTGCATPAMGLGP